MFFYNIRIAWKSLRRSPALSLLLLVAIALGTGVATTFSAVRHGFAKDPIPEKSAVLRYVRMDSWDPMAAYPGEKAGPPPQMTYQDATSILRSSIPVRQSPMMKSMLSVYPETSSGVRPFQEMTRLCFGDFFTMFNVPFRFGAPWTRAQDEKGEQVVVLGEALNDKLFGGADSTGKMLRIEDRDFRVAGVLKRWNIGVKYYDLTQNAVDVPEELFMPFQLMVAMELQTAGNTDGWTAGTAPGFQSFLRSETVWLQMWVELPSPAAEADYHAFLDGYALEQRKHGRFLRPLDNRVTAIPDLLVELNAVPAEASAMMIVSLLFLSVCCVNLVGILLGKFLARAPEIGVRRALGASRFDVFLQHIIECELLGVAGGLIGLGLSQIGIMIMNAYMETTASRADLFQLDAKMMLFSAALALLSGLAAGAYPAYRVCRVAPAAHLRTV
jgi:putative ABC transport system permease protein